jgi:chloramphenicol-sensitive protein RarD
VPALTAVQTRDRTEAVGIAAGVGAYTLWGLLTLYWPLLHRVGLVQLLAHRVVWALAILAVVLAVRRRWGWLRELIAAPKALGALAAAAVLISLNWAMFIWAATNQHVLEASLGYFINPLVSVLLGVVVLGERLDRLRWAAVVLAGLGVAWLTVDYGSPPWISLGLAFTFASYGLLKKLASVGPLESLGVETALLFLPALIYLGWVGHTGHGAFLAGGPLADPVRDALLVGTGLATAVPLLLFGAAAVRIPLSTVGLLQYLTPTLQLVVGVFVLHEPVGASQLVGFALVWSALVLLSVAMLRNRNNTTVATPVASEAPC